MTHNMEVYTIPTVILKHDMSYSPDEVGKVLKKLYQNRYDISLRNEALYFRWRN